MFGFLGRLLGRSGSGGKLERELWELLIGCCSNVVAPFTSREVLGRFAQAGGLRVFVDPPARTNLVISPHGAPGSEEVEVYLYYNGRGYEISSFDIVVPAKTLVPEAELHVGKPPMSLRLDVALANILASSRTASLECRPRDCGWLRSSLSNAVDLIESGRANDLLRVPPRCRVRSVSVVIARPGDPSRFDNVVFHPESPEPALAMVTEYGLVYDLYPRRIPSSTRRALRDVASLLKRAIEAYNRAYVAISTSLGIESLL